MTTEARYAAARVTMALLAATAGFVLLQHTIRMGEAEAAALLLRAFGAGPADVVFGTSILASPPGHAPFRAVVTPSCSALASLVALACLASVTPGPWRARKLAALFAALATVAGGNVVRLAGSVAVGFVAGRSALVLFHDWVGSIFTFVYTLGGYILMIYLLLPRSRPSAVHEMAR